MASIYVRLGNGGVTSLNGLAGVLQLSAGSGISITPSGNDLTIAATGSGANTALSNLTNPTAINQDLLLNAAKTLRLPNNVYLLGRNHTDTGNVELIKTDGSSRLIIGTTTNSSYVQIETNALNINAYNGNINLDAEGGATIIKPDGTSPGLLGFEAPDGGNVFVRSPQGPFANWIFTLPEDNGNPNESLITNGSGVTSWALRANSFLSNLDATAINVSLVSDTDGGFGLGSQSFAWGESYINAIYSNGTLEMGANSEFIDLLSYNGVLPPTLRFYDETGTQFVGLVAPPGLVASYTMAFPGAAPTFPNQTVTIDNVNQLVFTSQLLDSDDVPSLDYEQRFLYDSAGNPILDYSTAGTVSVSATLSASSLSAGDGASGSFTTTDLKTVTVVNGIITSIV